MNITNNKTDATSMEAKIIFLCNLYDSLLYTTIKNGDSLENVSSALEELAENGAINKDLSKLFVDNIPLYSVRVRVLLSIGEYTTVVERFKVKDASRPIVKALINPPLQSRIIDLRNTIDVTILSIVGSNELLLGKIKEITHTQLKTIKITSLSPHHSYIE